MNKRFKPARWFGLPLLATLTLLVGCGDQAASTHAPGQVRTAANKPGDGEKLSFNRDIRPILSEKCFACHGPDAAISDNAGGFRLDTRDTAVVPTPASGKTPIVPGDADASEIIKRITSAKPNLVMPPPKAKMSVTEAEVELLKRWINEGAEYEGHWAYKTPVKPDPPKTRHEDWVRSNIDRFVAARLEQVGLSPSEEADRATLIRRLSLDLIGLPPTPQEIDAFENDTSPNAYEKLVDRLLSSEHFGERMAIIWLDASRYGDTNGFHHDNIRTAWPWRQWVIEAFNANMPYDQFVTEQLAGDLLPNATQQQILASGFCRMHNINDEGGALDEEYIVEAIADRIETIGTVFMAQTYTCARCHDHKYDPISQDDYYSTWAYFNSVDQEEGVYRNNFEGARAYPPRMLWKSEELQEQIADAQSRLAVVQKQFDAAWPDIQAKAAKEQSALRDRAGVAWAPSKLVSATSSHPGTKTELKPDQSALLTGEVPDNETVTLVVETDQAGLQMIRLDALTDESLGKSSLGRGENGNAVLTHIRAKAVSIADPSKTQDITLTWAWADHAQTNGDYDILNTLRDDKLGWAVAGHEQQQARTALFYADKPFGFEGGTRIHVSLANQSQHAKHTLGRVQISVASANAAVLDMMPTVTSDWFEIGPYQGELPDSFEKVYGPENAQRISPEDPAVNGGKWKHQPAITDGKTHNFRGGKSVYFFGRSIFAPTKRDVAFSVGQLSALQVFHNGERVYANQENVNTKKRDAVKISLEPGENTLVFKVTKSGPGRFLYTSSPQVTDVPQLKPIALFAPGTKPKHLLDQYNTQLREGSDLGIKMAATQREIESLNDQAVPVLIMKERAQPRPAYILERGAYDGAIKTRIDDSGPEPVEVPVEPQERKPPSMVDLPMPEGAPNNRLGFAQWLTQDEHPLTARVHVNRVWQMLFGEGIVGTIEDFGSQAEWPSHPELLDYLAVSFVESDWDQKALIKSIVMSATYRQKALAKREAVDIDADNRLLSYFPRRRLLGELIRDQALYVSGLLNDEIGGPSVKPYQPGDLWNEVAIGGTNTGRFKRDSGEDLYRRSMYTFWKKTSPPAQMATFNAPTREFCVVRRDVTNTPLQALVLWNDEQFLEAARVLAQRTLKEAQGDRDRAALIYRRCTGAEPDDRQLAVLLDTLAYYRERYADSAEDAKSLLEQGEAPLPEDHDPAELASWMMIASTVLSLDETIVRD